MGFYSLPTVQHVRPENLLGETRDLYGFLQGKLGQVYDPKNFAESCKLYYDKSQNDGYWGQLITLVHWMALKRPDAEGQLMAIPVVDDVASEFGQSNSEPLNSLFEYLLQAWQWPHPIIRPRSKVLPNRPIKPYALILDLLCELHQISPTSAYLSNDEFLWLGWDKFGNNLLLEDTHVAVQKILALRRAGGWHGYHQSAETRTKLSYPKGILRNSTILKAEEGDENGHAPHGVFISLPTNKVADARHHAAVCREEGPFVEFDISKRISASPTDPRYRKFSDFLYDPARIQRWLDAVGDKRWTPSPLTSASPGGTISPTKFAKTAKLLAELGELDMMVEAKQRKEQTILRDHLFKYSEVAKCGLCGRDLPVRLLTAAHIKPRFKCEEAERRDPNIVMPACLLGCDSLFEFGFVVVDEGTIAVNVSTAVPPPDALESTLNGLKGKVCTYWHEGTAPYFRYHADKHRGTA